VRIDTGVEEGDTIPAEFDSMIAKIIAFGRNPQGSYLTLHGCCIESVVVSRAASAIVHSCGPAGPARSPGRRGRYRLDGSAGQ